MTNRGLFYLFEVVKSRKNDAMSSPDEAHRSEQLQHEGFSPVAAEGKQVNMDPSR